MGNISGRNTSRIDQGLVIPTLLLIGICCILFILAYQDITTRSVSVLGLGLFCLGVIAMVFIEQTTKPLIRYGVFNFGFLTIQFLLVSLYFSIKEKKLINIADKYLGWGDILFLVPVCLLFSPFNFILYYLSAIVFTLIGFLIWQQMDSQLPVTVPLVSGMAAVLMIALMASQMDYYDRYTDLIIYLLRRE